MRSALKRAIIKPLIKAPSLDIKKIHKLHTSVKSPLHRQINGKSSNQTNE